MRSDVPLRSACIKLVFLRAFSTAFTSLWFVSPCMEINVSVIQYHGGLLPDIILLTRCSYIGEPF